MESGVVLVNFEGLWLAGWLVDCLLLVLNPACSYTQGKLHTWVRWVLRRIRCRRWVRIICKKEQICQQSANCHFGLNKNLFETRYKESIRAHQQAIAIAYGRWAHTVGKTTQCMADEQFHFAYNKWDVTKNNNNKNKNKRKQRNKETTITTNRNSHTQKKKKKKIETNCSDSLSKVPVQQRCAIHSWDPSSLIIGNDE